LPTFVGQDGRVQNPTMIFRLGGVDVEKFLSAYGPDSIMGPEVAELILRLHNSHEYRLPRAKFFLFPTPRANELLCNCTRVLGRDGRELNPLLVRDMTEAEIEGRAQVPNMLAFSKITLRDVRRVSSTIPVCRSGCGKLAKCAARLFSAMRTLRAAQSFAAESRDHPGRSSCILATSPDLYG
jgi:hypothetical protein